MGSRKGQGMGLRFPAHLRRPNLLDYRIQTDDRHRFVFNPDPLRNSQKGNTANEVIMASDTKEVSLLYFLFYIHSSGGTSATSRTYCLICFCPGSISQLSESHAGGAQEFRIDEGAQEISNRLGESFGLENIVWISRNTRKDSSVSFCRD